LNTSEQLPEQIYLVDASIYIFQSHFSQYVECYDDDGGELSALFGFTQFLLQFLRRSEPSHVAIALDESLFCGFRHELCPNYKSNRELPDENLAMQLRACREVCELLGLPAFASRVFEADDIIGTLSNRIRQEAQGNTALTILTRDKDLGQLLQADADCLWDYAKNTRRSRADLRADLGIDPEQLPDFLGLAGDNVDCISGVPGVGPVKAKALLQEFKSLEDVYANLDKVAALPLRGAAGLANKLAEHQELARLSKKLATIVVSVEDAQESFGSSCIAELARQPVLADEFQDFLATYRFSASDRSRLLAAVSRVIQP